MKENPLEPSNTPKYTNCQSGYSCLFWWSRWPYFSFWLVRVAVAVFLGGQSCRSCLFGWSVWPYSSFWVVRVAIAVFLGCQGGHSCLFGWSGQPKLSYGVVTVARRLFFLGWQAGKGGHHCLYITYFQNPDSCFKFLEKQRLGYSEPFLPKATIHQQLVLLWSPLKYCLSYSNV